LPGFLFAKMRILLVKMKWKRDVIENGEKSFKGKPKCFRFISTISGQYNTNQHLIDLLPPTQPLILIRH
ncbi:MAG: hypothetical protein ACI81W_003574, partial [Saprospiraceae bacterium]